VRSREEFSKALEQIGRPAILKSASFGYDGKGQHFIGRDANADDIWKTRPGDESILERAIDFEKEISVIVARGQDGAVATFPVCENLHRDHILDFTLAPARVNEPIQRRAAELAIAVAEKLNLIGLVAVEMFLGRDGNLLVNEIAPRPHNSGHWTIEGCVTSQFEQHVRAVCGLALGSTAILQPSAMANLLGDLWQTGEPDWARALEVERVHLHLYGKREPRPRRKMGHLTALDSSADGAMALVSRARDGLSSAKK
jgi:5-(carboxyamino)imidazole ribonucleotide synthase